MSAKPRSTIKTRHDRIPKILGTLRIDRSSKKPKQLQNNKFLSSITFKEFVTESAWSHLIEIFESICCFFGFLSTDKKIASSIYYGYIADLSFWGTLRNIQPCQFKLIWFVASIYFYPHANTLTLFWDIGLSGTLQSEQPRGSWMITQGLEPCLTWKWKLKVKYHNNVFVLSFFLKKTKWQNLQRKYKMPYFGAIFAQIGAKVKLLQNLGSQFFDVKIMLLHEKNQKKLSNHVKEKHLADQQKELGARQTAMIYQNSLFKGV